MERDELITAQYGALRAELLQLMQANETRVTGIASFTSAVWATLASLVATGIDVPGVAVFAPVLPIVLGLSMHVVYSKRIANISSYLGHAVGSACPAGPNWEHDIAVFARETTINMSARVSVIAIYTASALVTSLGAVAVPLARIVIQGNASASNGLDLSATLLLSLTTFVSFMKLSADYKEFATRRSDFDSYWAKRFGPVS